MKSYKILINIMKGRLRVVDESGISVAVFPVICGRHSSRGKKRFEGDQRTPRGSYYVCTINPESKFTLFFGISYPNLKDAREALDRREISFEQFEKIKEAVEKNLRPPWNTPLGGEIGIHGGGIDRDGTRGCIGMRDEDVLKLKQYVVRGTPVEIEY